MARGDLDPRRGRNGRPWRRLVEQLCPPGSLCEMPICKFDSREILFGLRRGHPQGPSLDHIVRLIDGGHPTDPRNLRPAHLGCNASDSNRRQRERPRRTSREYPF